MGGSWESLTAWGEVGSTDNFCRNQAEGKRVIKWIQSSNVPRIFGIFFLEIVFCPV